jgi:flagellar export protein FliJ
MAEPLTERRLLPIKDLRRRRVDLAAQRLADAQRVLLEREQQLTELENYQEPQATGDISIQMLANRDQFRRRLAEAVRVQRIAVTDAQQKVEAARQAWIEQRCEAQKIDKLIDRSRHHEQQKQERRAQNDMDEFALRFVDSAVSSS